MDNQNYTRELNDVLKYMSDILAKEFPTRFLTQEYLVASILDNKRCHANMILEICLMSTNIEELKNIFLNYLKEHINIYNDINNIQYDSQLQNIIDGAVEEKNKINSIIVGSEHILLSILNPKNNNLKMQNIFKNMGIDYDFIFNKCNEKNKKLVEAAKNAFNKKNIGNMMPNIPIMPNIPLKGEINPKMLIGKTNFIQSFTIDINKQAEDGKIDELVGRKRELTQIIEVLARRKKNNVVLVGKPGCGKTAIVNGLANLIVQGNVPDIMKDKKIVQLNIASLIAGTYLRGAFEERIKGLFDEMKSSNKYILFIDDIHTVLKSTSKEKDTDISSALNDILADGDVRVIGTTSFKDYRNSVENNVMIARRLQKIVIEPSSTSETIDILNKNKHYYEDFHNVTYTNESIKKCVELSERYISDRSLPDSAIDVLDFCGAHASVNQKKPQNIIDIEVQLEKLSVLKSDLLNSGNFEEAENLLSEENELKSELNNYNREYQKNKNDYRTIIDINNVCEAISEITNIPTNKLSVDERKQLINIDKILKESVVGQDDAIDVICKSIKRNKMGLGNPNKVIFSGLMIGQSGCGKTLVAKKLAEEIFGDANALIRIDMSEYSEKASVSKLIGSSAGYVGYENGGILTEAIKNRQYCVLLLDEIEKANEEVYNLFLQLLDEGQLSDNTGNKINFKNTIVLMTSNCGAKQVNDFGNGVGFTPNSDQNTKMLYEKELKNTFRPEFLNRIDQIVYFNNLTEENYFDITKLELKKTVEKVNKLNVTLTYTDDVVNLITNSCKNNKLFGARPIIRYIQDNIEDLLTDFLILNENIKNIQLDTKDDKVIVLSFN